MLELIIPLPPISWAAPLKGKHGFYDPKEKEKRCIRFYLREQYEGDPISRYVALDFIFTFRIPKSAPKKNIPLMLSGEIRPTRSDCTNLQKLYEDCLKGIVITDDRNVVKIFSQKLYGESESILIRVYTLDEYTAET